MALAGRLKATKGITEHCIKLTPYYTATRYPDVGIAIDGAAAKALVDRSRKVLEWARQTLRQ